MLRSLTSEFAGLQPVSSDTAVVVVTPCDRAALYLSLFDFTFVCTENKRCCRFKQSPVISTDAHLCDIFVQRGRVAALNTDSSQARGATPDRVICGRTCRRELIGSWLQRTRGCSGRG